MSTPVEPDPSLRRIQRDAAIICGVLAIAALAIQRGRPDGALGVVAGGALMAFSYRAIKGGVDALVRKSAGAAPVDESAYVSKGAVAWALFKFIGRYAVIGLSAWAVLVPLRAHPIGLFAGVTVPVIAIGIEAVRLVRHRGGTD